MSIHESVYFYLYLWSVTCILCAQTGHQSVLGKRYHEPAELAHGKLLFCKPHQRILYSTVTYERD